MGSEYPYSTYPLNGLANLYTEQGKYEQAKLLYQRTLTIRQQQQGAQHPETAAVLHDFAWFHELQNRQDEALTLYQQALAIREQQLDYNIHARWIHAQALSLNMLELLPRLFRIATGG